MKKNILVFGLISGFILSAFMAISMYICYNSNNFEGSMAVGYASMLIAFSFIFVAVKNYRDKFNAGIISFGKGFRIGLFITLIASTMYVIAWLIDYYLFIPDFMDRYTEAMISKSRAEGDTQLELNQEISKMESYKEMYKNPVLVVLFTYLEVLPIGLVVSVICALILKRRTDKRRNLAV